MDPMDFIFFICATTQLREEAKAEEVVERQAGRHLRLKLLRLVRVELFLRLFDQADHVAHAENAPGNTVGVEFFDLVELFADADEIDRLTGEPLRRQSIAAAGV